MAGEGASLRFPRAPGPRAINRPYVNPFHVGVPRQQMIAVQIRGLREAFRIPPGLLRAYEGMMERLELQLVANYKSHVPKSPEGRVGKHVMAKRWKRQTIGVGVYGTIFAASLNRGFTSRPRRAKVLRFVNEKTGDLVYTKRTRTAGRRFHEKAISTSGPIVEATYMGFFNDPRDFA